MTHTLLQEKCAMPANGPHAHKIWWVSQSGRADYREPPPCYLIQKDYREPLSGQAGPMHALRPNSCPAIMT
jgi:hypothetical protein